MSSEVGFPGVKVELRQEFGRWRLYVDGEQQDVTAKEALKLARTVSKIHRPRTEHVIDYVGAVQAHIRLDADEAEAQALKERERAAQEVESRAARAHEAQLRALLRRREADELAPRHELPPPFVVGD